MNYAERREGHAEHARAVELVCRLVADHAQVQVAFADHPQLLDAAAFGEGDRGMSDRSSTTGEPVELTAVPYYAWANRGAGAMRVWLPTSPP